MQGSQSLKCFRPRIEGGVLLVSLRQSLWMTVNFLPIGGSAANVVQKRFIDLSAYFLNSEIIAAYTGMQGSQSLKCFAHDSAAPGQPQPLECVLTFPNMHFIRIVFEFRPKGVKVLLVKLMRNFDSAVPDQVVFCDSLISNQFIVNVFLTSNELKFFVYQRELLPNEKLAQDNLQINLCKANTDAYFDRTFFSHTVDVKVPHISLLKLSGDLLEFAADGIYRSMSLKAEVVAVLLKTNLRSDFIRVTAGNYKHTAAIIVPKTVKNANASSKLTSRLRLLRLSVHHLRDFGVWGLGFGVWGLGFGVRDTPNVSSPTV